MGFLEDVIAAASQINQNNEAYSQREIKAWHMMNFWDLGLLQNICKCCDLLLALCSPTFFNKSLLMSLTTCQYEVMKELHGRQKGKACPFKFR